MCGVVLVTAQDLQAITLAPVETPGCEGAVEPVCTLGYVSTLCQGHMCKWCTLGRGLRARLHEGLARAIVLTVAHGEGRRRWWRGCPSAALLAALGEEDFLAADTVVVRHEDVAAAKKAQHEAAKAIAKAQCVARQPQAGGEPVG